MRGGKFLIAPKNVSDAAPFEGQGTVMLTDISNLSSVAGGMSPTELVVAMRKHLDFVINGIEQMGGCIESYAGSFVIAYWRQEVGPSNHAQLAFDTACGLIASLRNSSVINNGLSLELDVVLGTGEMAGGFLGPKMQFQVFGKAKAVADRISAQPRTGGSCVRLSQYTRDLLANSPVMTKIGSIARDGFEDLEVFSYRPVAVS
jgi:class 3 adenylate cyclase